MATVTTTHETSGNFTADLRGKPVEHLTTIHQRDALLTVIHF